MDVASTLTPAALYDPSPLGWLLLLGAVFALGPLVWVAWRYRRTNGVRRWRALTVLTLFLTFDLVLFGAFTRLTDSGLGCPDWPGCYGSVSPLGAHAQISDAQAALPSGPVTHRKAWVEMIHRYLAGGVGMLLIATTVLAWLERRRRLSAAIGGRVPPARTLPAPPSAWWAVATLVWVCLQGAFGAWTVTMKLFPAIVTLHLIGGLVLLALLSAQSEWLGQADARRAASPISAGLRRGAWLVLAMVAVQIVLGGWVSTNYAVLACAEFPTCQGRWWPPMAFDQGFQIWRPLGELRDGSYITLAGLTAIHYMHRLFAYVVFAALLDLARRLARVDALRRQARWIGGLALWQFATGLGNVVLDWPLAAAVSHTGGAAALIMVLTWTVAASRTAGIADALLVPRHATSTRIVT